MGGRRPALEGPCPARGSIAQHAGDMRENRGERVAAGVGPVRARPATYSARPDALDDSRAVSAAELVQSLGPACAEPAAVMLHRQVGRSSARTAAAMRRGSVLAACAFRATVAAARATASAPTASPGRPPPVAPHRAASRGGRPDGRRGEGQEPKHPARVEVAERPAVHPALVEHHRPADAQEEEGHEREPTADERQTPRRARAAGEPQPARHVQRDVARRRHRPRVADPEDGKERRPECGGCHQTSAFRRRSRVREARRRCGRERRRTAPPARTRPRPSIRARAERPPCRFSLPTAQGRGTAAVAFQERPRPLLRGVRLPERRIYLAVLDQISERRASRVRDPPVGTAL